MSKTKSQLGRLSKNKGANFEREIANTLTSELYPDKSGEVRRVPLSGGWSHGMGFDLQAFAFWGDRREPVFDPRWDLYVECKIRKGINLYGLWTGEVADGPFTWLQDACRKAATRPSLLVFRQDFHKEALFLMTVNDAKLIRLNPHRGKFATLHISGVWCVLGLWRDFVKAFGEFWRTK